MFAAICFCVPHEKKPSSSNPLLYTALTQIYRRLALHNPTATTDALPASSSSSDDALFSRSHADIRDAICANAGFDRPFVTMNALAAVVACYGLLADSGAVVIGAMIIATLLGPISAFSLAIVDGELPLQRRALLALLGGAFLVFGISFVIGWVNRDVPLTHEIRARTAPTILDLAIAVAGGAAGTYATISRKFSANLVGVAVATALVPPLAVVGMCLARGLHQMALGAALLFGMNLLGIQAASSIVLWMNGFHKIISQRQSGKRLLARNLVSPLIIGALAVSLSVSFYQALEQQQFETNVRDHLRDALRRYPGVHIADLRFETDDDDTPATRVICVVRSPYSLGPDKVRALQKTLPRAGGAEIELHVRSVLASEVTVEGYVHQLPEAEANAGEEDQIRDETTAGE